MVQINSAESNRASLRYVKEVTWGTTPTSGVTQEMRITKSSLEASKDTKVSEEIRADRMVPNIIEVAASSGGDVDVEFSAGSLDPFFEGFLLSYFNTSLNYFQVKGTAVTITDTDEITLVGADYTGYLTVGQWIKLEGFLTAVGNNGYYKIATKTYSGGNTVVTVTVAGLTIEGGSAYSKFLDANDVLIAATTATFTAGNTIDGGGANGFGNVKVGQKIYVEGLGKETGTVQFDVTDPPEGSTITIYDGVNEAIIFEIRTNQALVAEGHYGVALSGTPATMATNLKDAINKNFQLETFDCSATAATDTVTITNHNRTGGSIAASDAASTNLTAFSGGSATKGGFYTVASVIDNDTITTVETLSADTNVGTKTVVVKGSHLRNPGTTGEIVKQSFTIETGFTDVSKYFLMNGMRVGGIELSVDTGNIVAGKVSFQGRETVRSNSETLTGGGYTVLDSTVTDVLNATSNVGQITKDGTALTSAIMKLDFKGDAGLREQRAIGEKFPAGIGYGRLSISGSFSAYFDSFALYDTFINHVTTSLGFDFEDVDHNTYFFSFPSLKVTSDKIVPDGIDKDVMDDSDFTVQRNGVLKTMMMIDRFSSVRSATFA